MKKLLSLYFFILCGLLLAQEYRPMLNPNNEWIYSNFIVDMATGNKEYTDYHIKMTDNTIVFNGKTYHTFHIRTRHRINENPTSNWTEWTDAKFYLSEHIEDKKVYIYYEEGNNLHSPGEFLLYDFNLGIGDSMDFGGFVEAEDENPALQTITNITFENVYGLDNVKTYHFEEYPDLPFVVYEGIGSSMGLFTSSFVYDAGWEMTDFGENLNNNEVSQPKSKIYPNPFSNQIQINSSKPIQQLQLFDLSGKLIQSKSNLNELNAQLGSLKSGVYMLRITYQNNTKETLKMVKK